MKLSFICSYFLSLSILLILNPFTLNYVIEENKSNRYEKIDLIKPTNFISQGQLHLSLYESNALDNNESPVDGLLMFFETDGNNGIDINDAIHITNLDENFASNNDGVLLSIESRAAPEDGEEIQLEVNTYRSTDYTIVAEGVSMLCAIAYLYDTYTNIYTEIPQNGIINYNYSVISSVPDTIVNDRFKLVFSAFDIELLWQGSVSNNWSDPNNWTPNEVPDYCSEIVIPQAQTPPYISEDVTIANLNLNEGASLIIPSGISVNVMGDLNMYSESDLYSGLIVKGFLSVEGTSKYYRYTNSEFNNRDLIAPPLSGQSWSDFLASDNHYNSNILFNNGSPLPDTAYLFGHFEKGEIDDYVIYDYSSVESLYTGKGYRVATNTLMIEGNGEPLIFTGSLVTDTFDVAIKNDLIGDFAQWNLIGNPYASYINVESFLNHVGSVSGVSNLSLLGEDTAAIYGYDANNSDGSGSNWTITNLLEGPANIAPGQGFFVSSKLASASLEFTPEMQIVSNEDDFIIGRALNNNHFVKIKVNTLLDSCITSIYFHGNASLGLDIGYDAALFGEVSSALGLYSHLVEDNEDVPMSIQAVNSNNLSDIVIPLGVNANNNVELNFSIADMELPSTSNIYLEDTVENTLTLLNNSNYNILLNTEISGTGRFFLRITQNVLTNTQNDLEAINIIISNDSEELILKGKLEEKTKLKIYDILGREVMSKELDLWVYENRINLSSFKKGGYILVLKNMRFKKSKKLIIQ